MGGMSEGEKLARDPNFEGYKTGKRRDAGHEGELAWEYRDGQWFNRATGKGAADGYKPGGEATPGYWLTGMTSGDRDIMGINTVQGQEKVDAKKALIKEEPPPGPDLADKLLQRAGADSLRKQKAQAGRKSTFLQGLGVLK